MDPAVERLVGVEERQDAVDESREHRHEVVALEDDPVGGLQRVGAVKAYGNAIDVVKEILDKTRIDDEGAEFNEPV